ncbi:uracil-DNA glycosylase [Frigoribacterium sp. 2-23]|uniref:uracil-DNA glycosylase n=1 Tax=Frigoribacterium sp. 2-23 TaxID=3415006 RepID=UPI003C70417B
MPRQMADPAFHAAQSAGAFTAPHVAPINDFVNTIQDRDGRGWVPYVPPHHGGVDARVISILRDPGPKTQLGTGSGFISVENDDPTAERMARLFDLNGIPARSVLPWNAYPWYIDAAPNAEQSTAGARVLLELLELTPEIDVVLLQGRDAEKAWRRAAVIGPRITQRFSVHATIHPGRQALFHPDPEERQRRIAHQERTFEEIGEHLAR